MRTQRENVGRLGLEIEIGEPGESGFKEKEKEINKENARNGW